MKVVQLSLSGSLVILAVMGLRLLLRNAPRRVFCLLWLLAGLRLMLPFEIESRFSLQPKLGAVIPELVQQMDELQVSHPPYYEHSGDIRNIPAVTPGLQSAMEEPEFAETPQLTAEPTVNVDYTAVAAWLWVSGAAGLLTYSLLSYIRLKRRVRSAVILEEGIWACRNTDTAFVLGFFRPQIYLPVGLSDQEQRLILKHEKVHIARLDHWSKAVGFVVLAVHWCNPLVWAAFTLLCRDMEMACDEAVVKSMTVQERKAYTAALLQCSARANRIGGCPVAFSEVSVKRRIVNVLKYKKKGFWIIVAAVIAVAVVAVCLLTSPVEVGPSGEPFATASEPGAWVRGINVDAVCSARVYVRHSKSYTAEGYSVASSRYDYTAEQLEPLLTILNELPAGAFGPVQQLDRGIFGFYETMLGANEGVSVTVFDEVNGLAALLRLHNGGTVDLILTDELEKAKTDDLYVDNLYCWTIQSMELSEYMQGLLEQPPATNIGTQ